MAALDFPASPTGGQIFTSGNRAWQWDGLRWVAASAGTGFLPLSGGTLSGDLTINSPDGNNLTLNGPSNDWAGILMKAPSGQGNWIGAYIGANERWEVDLGNGIAETGGNSGSNFQINRYADDGSFIDNAILINRQSGRASFSQPIIAPQGDLVGFVNK